MTKQGSLAFGLPCVNRHERYRERYARISVSDAWQSRCKIPLQTWQRRCTLRCQGWQPRCRESLDERPWPIQRHESIDVFYSHGCARIPGKERLIKLRRNKRALALKEAWESKNQATRLLANRLRKWAMHSSVARLTASGSDKPLRRKSSVNSTVSFSKSGRPGPLRKSAKSRSLVARGRLPHSTSCLANGEVIRCSCSRLQAHHQSGGVRP